MQYKGMNLCDFCFAPKGTEEVCPSCGLSHETYKYEAGLLAPGTNLNGKYIIGKVLGRGGFGATYLAYSSLMDKVVAIKEYLPMGIVYRGKGEEKVTVISEEKKQVFDKGAKRFFEEAKTISKFNKNENVVSVYEFFYANDTVYYSMEYLEGLDLKKYIQKQGGKLKETEVLKIFRGVCNALVTVHATHTLHRDISPDNIFICLDGSVKLIDFGAAKQVIANEQMSYSIVIKQGFAPAEQYTRRGNQGVWTDIYAVGATMYYALSGEIPPDAINRGENPDLDFGRVGIQSKDVRKIIGKCMEMKISNRYQSVIELKTDIDKIYKEPPVTTMPESPAGFGTSRQRKLKPKEEASVLKDRNRNLVKKEQEKNMRGPAKTPSAKKPGLSMTVIISGGIAVCIVLLIAIAVVLFQGENPAPVESYYTSPASVEQKAPEETEKPEQEEPDVPAEEPSSGGGSQSSGGGSQSSGGASRSSGGSGQSNRPPSSGSGSSGSRSSGSGSSGSASPQTPAPAPEPAPDPVPAPAPAPIEG